MTGILLILAAIIAAYCFAVLRLMRQLPIWLRLLLCTLLLVFLCPVMSIHEGGGGIEPAIYWLTYYLDALTLDDFTSFAFQIACVWGAANFILMIGVGVCYLVRKRRAKHLASETRGSDNVSSLL